MGGLVLVRCWVVAVAHGGEPVPPMERVVLAEPAAVYRVIADAHRWPLLWGLDDDGGARSHQPRAW